MLCQVLLLSLLFTGYLVNIAAVTPVLQWVHYLSVFFFGFESLIVNEMSGINLIFAVRCSKPMLHHHVDVFCKLSAIQESTLSSSQSGWDLLECVERTM